VKHGLPRPTVDHLLCSRGVIQTSECPYAVEMTVTRPLADGKSAKASPNLGSVGSALRADGLAQIEWPTDRAFEGLADQLGIVVRSQRRLEPKTRVEAHPASLSADHGRGRFPWHTDGAQETQPPRWLLMRVLTPTHTPTHFLDAMALLESSYMEEAVTRGAWSVSGGPHTFYAPVRSPISGRLRWNQDLMKPASRLAREVEHLWTLTLGQVEYVEHDWRLGRVLIVDNTRWLHARPAVSLNDNARQLERILADNSRSSRLGLGGPGQQSHPLL